MGEWEDTDSPFLPSEPEILAARLGFEDAQAALGGPTTERKVGMYELGWYGTSVSRETGSFALVNREGPLADLIGDVVKVRSERREVFAYVFGSEWLDYDMHITRALFARLDLLAFEKIDVVVEVV